MTIRKLLPDVTSASSPYEIYLVSTSSSQSSDYSIVSYIALPSDILPNDIILLVSAITDLNGSWYPYETTPAGFNIIDEEVAGNTEAKDWSTLRMYYKIAEATDSGALIQIQHESANQRRTIALVFRTTKASPVDFVIPEYNGDGGGASPGWTSFGYDVASGSTLLPRVVVGVYLNCQDVEFGPAIPEYVDSGWPYLAVRFCIFNGYGPDIVTYGYASSTTMVLSLFYFTV